MVRLCFSEVASYVILYASCGRSNVWKFLNRMSCELAKVAPKSERVSATSCLGEEVVFALGVQGSVWQFLYVRESNMLQGVQRSELQCDFVVRLSMLGAFIVVLSPFPSDLLVAPPQVVILRDVGAHALFFSW